MSLPTHALLRRVPRAGRPLALALFAAVLAASPREASATHYVVDAGGGGDFTTIQAAVNQRTIAFRDTIVVMPGTYAETISVPTVPQHAWIVGVSGPGVTRLQSVVFTGLEGYPKGAQNRIEGLTFGSEVSFYADARSVYFEGCVFEAAVVALGTGSSGAANLENCDFHARTYVYGYLGYLDHPLYPPFRRLRFRSAPLAVSNGASGPSAFVDCTFEGPADTLLYIWPSYDDVTLIGCRFASARKGVVVGGRTVQMAQRVRRCTFTDLVDYGIFFHDSMSSWVGNILVADSRFERCGTALHWVATGDGTSSGAVVVRDTILASTGNGLEIGRYFGRIDSTIVDGSGGHGAVLLHTMRSGGEGPPYMLAVGSTFSNNGGDGLRVENRSTYWTLPVYGLPNIVSNCRFSNNRGAGLHMNVAVWDVNGCVSFGNDGDGFACATSVPGRGGRLVSNTSVFNRGEGFRVEGPPAPADSLQLVQRNVSAMNALDGFRVPHHAFGSFSFNDAWGNCLAPYVGAWASLDSNLTVDPKFCDLSAGVAGLGLENGSPCGPSGVYGLIGARGEECPSTVAVEPGTPGALAFAVRPSVARGSVEFVAPPGAGEGRVELYDLAGRLVWRAPLGPATGTVRWYGESERGRAAAGLYWARFTRGDERATRRLVWLE